MLAGNSEVVSISSANQSVYQSVRRFAMDGLNDLIRVLMESVDDALFELSDKVDNDRERNLYFEAMREIRIQREALQRNFDHELARRFERLVNPNAQARNFDDADELTLVELEAIEDGIAIDNMIKKARPQFEDDLFAVGERLCTVLRRKEISPDDNPLDPKSICDSFHDASEVLETEIQVRLIFYKLFERYVINNLGHFYRELNTLFAQKGVLPDLSVEQARLRRTTRFMANRIRNNPARGAGPASAHGGGVAAPAGLGGVPAVGVPAGDGLYATLQQAVGTIAPAPGGGAGEVFEPAGGTVGEGGHGEFVAALSGLRPDPESALPLTAIDPRQMQADNRRRIELFVQQNRHRVAAADSQAIDVVSMLFDFFFDDEALPQPIKVLIGRLQIPILKVAILDKDFFNHKKHPARRLLDCLSRAALGWSENPDEEQALVARAEEIVDFLLAEFTDDVAVFATALADLEAFLEGEREARQRAEAALREEADRRDRRIREAREAADALIARLTAGRELGFEVLEFLNTTWSSVLFKTHLARGAESDHWQNLARIGATLVWTLKPKHSEAERNKILKMIPSMLRALSRGMDLARIDTGEQNRIFQMLAQQHALVVKLTARNIAAGQAAAASASPPSRPDAPAGATAGGGANPDEVAGTGSAAAGAAEQEPAVARSAEDTPAADRAPTAEPLAEVERAPANRVIEDLEQFTREVGNGDAGIGEEIVLVDEFDQALELGGVDDWTEQAAAIEIGSWIEFSESPARVLMARLSWKSKVTGKLVFVNRKGQRVRNMSVAQLADELRAGHAVRIEASSVFDRAVFSIMNKLAG